MVPRGAILPVTEGTWGCPKQFLPHVLKVKHELEEECEEDEEAGGRTRGAEGEERRCGAQGLRGTQ